MAQKVAKLGIKRDNNFLYYIKGGDVWRVPRRQPGVKKGKGTLVAHTEHQMETGFIYFLDKAGDIARAVAKVGGQKRKTARKKKTAVARKVARKPARMGKRKVTMAKKTVAKKTMARSAKRR